MLLKINTHCRCYRGSLACPRAAIITKKPKDKGRTSIPTSAKGYNEKRIKISLGNMSPLEYRRSLGLSA